MSQLELLHDKVKSCLGKQVQTSMLAFGELTITLAPEDVKSALLALRDDATTCFDQLIDLCGVDYSRFDEHQDIVWDKPRFAVVYHLLSLKHNWRIRVKSFIDGEPPLMDSVINIWPVANWFEREAFDMLGIVFNGHPDLRRILTDYGFIGHPFRKDFPLSGHVEMRYDEEKRRVIYEPVSIEPRVLVPRINRHQDA